MEVRVLGPLEVVREGVAVHVPGGKQRALLARLLVEPGRVVSVDALADALWASAPPANVAGTVQVYVSNLRRALGQTSIATRAPGYAVVLDGHELDAVELADRVARARAARGAGRPADALEEARRATSLLRGEPFVEVAFEQWAQSEILRLRGLALAAHEELEGALLDLGRHADALPDLEALVAAHPFHERLRSQLMVALYRDGRQADALRCYADGRRLLVEELGVEPGPELQQVEARVLAQDPTLVTAGTTAPADGAPGREEGCPSIVGRDDARDVLQAAWRDACSGRPRIVVLEGEPGIGKTALAGWIGEVAAADGGRVGWGRAHDLAGSPPHWPWATALRDLASEVDAVASASGPTAPADGDALAGSLSALGRTGPPPTAPFQLFDAVTRTLRETAARAPVLLVLDDLHWADQATLDLLQFVARSAGRARVLLVVAHRPVPPEHPMAALRADLATERSVERLPLGPLDGAGVRALVDRLSSGAVDAATVDVVAARTGGNPFFVEELLKLLRGPDGRLDVGRAAVPDTVRDVVRARAAHLGADALEVVTLVSFAPDVFAAALPTAVLGADGETVASILDDAVRDGLIVEAEGRPGSFRFAHDMVRHAFYDAVPARRRAETHRTIGRSLVELLGDDAWRAAPEVATHFSRAVDVGAAAEAVHWARVAAAQAVQAMAYPDAVRHLRRSLFVTRTHLRDERCECEVLIELAAAARLAADAPTAQLARERAHRLATHLGDQILATRAANVLLAPRPPWVRRAR